MAESAKAILFPIPATSLFTRAPWSAKSQGANFIEDYHGASG